MSMKMSPARQVDVVERVERALSEPLRLQDYLHVCTMQEVPWSRAIRVWRATGGNFERAVMVLQVIDEAVNPDDGTC